MVSHPSPQLNVASTLDLQSSELVTTHTAETSVVTHESLAIANAENVVPPAEALVVDVGIAPPASVQSTTFDVNDADVLVEGAPISTAIPGGEEPAILENLATPDTQQPAIPDMGTPAVPDVEAPAVPDVEEPAVPDFEAPVVPDIEADFDIEEPVQDPSTLWSGMYPDKPSKSTRYDDIDASTMCQVPRTIDPGMRAAVDLDDPHAWLKFKKCPDGWEEFHHPVEGRTYFYNPTLKLMTETYIRFESEFEALMAWWTKFEIFCSRSNGDLAGCDVVLRITGETCAYYLVDHESQIIRWLTEVNTADLGINNTRSVLHLRALLHEEYWTHEEYMPKNANHHEADRVELKDAISASMIDHMTSEGSISPFTDAECQKYLLALDQARNLVYLNWIVARLFGLLVHSRIVNLHGEWGARLDRTMVVGQKKPPPRTSRYQYLDNLFFQLASHQLNYLEKYWVDRIIYTHHWRELVESRVRGWKAAVKAAGLLMLINVVLISGSVGSPLVRLCSICAVFIAAISSTVGLYLIHEHRALGRFAAHGAAFIQSHETAETGLQSLSQRYATPWASAYWSLLFTGLGIVMALARMAAALLADVLLIPLTIVVTYVLSRGLTGVSKDWERGCNVVHHLTAPPLPPRWTVR